MENNDYKGNISIIDGDLENSVFLCKLLNENGYTVSILRTEKESISSILCSLPDLILLGNKFFDNNANEICKQLKNENATKDIPVIYVCQSEGNDVIHQYGFDIGCVDYINKPFQEKEILARVKTHIQLKLLRNQFENHIAEQKLEEELIRQEIIELAELNASKDKFFSIIAHDLKSPFNGFLGLTHLMEVQDLSVDKMKEYSKIINESANNLYKLLENLLTWARMQKGIIDFKPEIYSLSNIVSKNITFFNENAKQKNIDVISLISEQICVYADLPMINTVIRNFISNAIKFTRKDGKIVIKADEKEKEILFCVNDSGIGMTSEVIGKLFKLDEKVSRSGTEGETSTGLGLLLCKEFIERHKGKIWAESVHGNGSSFFFSLPKVTGYDAFNPSI
jgi:signal transduction histidine kinase